MPHRILWCPHASMALFDAPPGYQIGLSALVKDVVFERTEASNGILDNLRLYGREVYPRSPYRRATGTVAGNSPPAADDAGHVTGAVSQAWAQNLPGSERSMGALNPLSLWYHDRAFWPTAFTRTDTQLHIDRTLSIANILGAYGIAASAGGSGGGGGGSSGGGGGGAPAPVPGSGPGPVPPGLPGC